MKKLIWFAIFTLLALVGTTRGNAQASPLLPLPSVTGSLNAVGANCATTDACLAIHLASGTNGVAVTLTGAWVADVAVEQSADDAVTWAPAGASLTVNGQTTYRVTAMTDFRVRVSAYTSGIVVAVINAGLSAVGLGVNNVFTGTNTFSNINNVVVVDGVTYAKTEVGIQAAVAAAAALGTGSTVYLPVGTYNLGSGLPILITTRVNVVGSGWGTLLSVAASVGATKDVFLIQPIRASTITGLRFQDFFIAPESGTPARHAFNFDGTNGEIANVVIDHVSINPKLGGNAVSASGSGNAQGTPVLTVIQNSTLFGGVVMSNAGDTVRVIGNQIAGAGAALDVSFQAGATTLIVQGNNIGSDGGIHVGTGVNAIQFVNNEIETFATFTGSHGAVLDLDATVESPAGDAMITNNSFQVVNGITANGIRVNFANRTNISGNHFGRGATISKDILVTANAADTFIGTNTWVSGTPFASMVWDAGTRTVLATEFNSGLMLGNNQPLSTIDDGGVQRSMIYTDATGVVNLLGYHGNSMERGVNGATYIYDDSGSANLVAAFTTCQTTAPVATGIVTSGGFSTRTTNGAATGVLRLAATDAVAWRNNANAADILLSKDTSDRLLYNGNQTTVAAATLVTTTATSDNITVIGATTTSHCSVTPTNAAAATNIATTFVSAKATNLITVSHTATASMNYDLLCTPN